jgi:hypothetical protein
LIAQAKQWSARHGISLSQAVAALFAQLGAQGLEGEALSPWTRQLCGASPGRWTDEDVRDLLRQRTAHKHG